MKSFALKLFLSSGAAGCATAMALTNRLAGAPTYRSRAMFPLVIEVLDRTAPNDRPDPNANYYLDCDPHHGTTINPA